MKKWFLNHREKLKAQGHGKKPDLFDCSVLHTKTLKNLDHLLGTLVGFLRGRLIKPGLAISGLPRRTLHACFGEKAGRGLRKNTQRHEMGKIHDSTDSQRGDRSCLP